MWGYNIRQSDVELSKPMYKRRIFTRRNQSRTRSFRLPIGLFLALLAIVLCVFIPSNPINISGLSVPNQTPATLPPSFTPPPQPTKEHIGRLIFTCTRGDYNQLCMVNADGTDYQQLTELEAHSYYPV